MSSVSSVSPSIAKPLVQPIDIPANLESGIFRDQVIDSNEGFTSVPGTLTGRVTELFKEGSSDEKKIEGRIREVEAPALSSHPRVALRSRRYPIDCCIAAYGCNNYTKTACVLGTVSLTLFTIGGVLQEPSFDDEVKDSGEAVLIAAGAFLGVYASVFVLRALFYNLDDLSIRSNPSPSL